MDPSGLTRERLFLIRGLGHEVILNAVDRQKLAVIEVPDHPMVGEILEQNGYPSIGVGADGEGNVLAVDPRPQIDFE
ncbi:MAG: hypothetical protein V3W05_03030 [candidate division NC10 bacterium]